VITLIKNVFFKNGKLSGGIDSTDFDIAARPGADRVEAER
jgi:hypothetical protein